MSSSIDSTTTAALPGEVRAIAYYLPQYHPIPENDIWWGRGFTEWTNVTRAKPLFDGHEQPHRPTELGYYDLRVPEVRAAQAELAAAHGIHGFCYYYYSFGPKRLLERPLLDMLASGEPDFPFCICWANETWSRRWDGAEAQVLIAQDDSPAHYRNFIHEVLPVLQDRRYIRVNEAPVLLVYRVGRIPDAASVAQYWREQAKAAGLPGLYLCAVQSHDRNFDPRVAGYDAAVEFPPSPWKATKVEPSTLPGMDPDFTGSIFDYPSLLANSLRRATPDYRLLRGVMTDWDNTARRGPAAYLFRGASPREYETWLRGSVAWTLAHNPPQERLVFVNAWNEWAEGAHLEPDERHGRAWLEATQRALSRADAWRGALTALREGKALAPEMLTAYAEDIRFALERLDRVDQPATIWGAAFSKGAPRSFDGRPTRTEGTFALEAIQGHAPNGKVEVRPGEPIHVRGWAVAPGADLGRAPAVVALSSPTTARLYTAALGPRTPRFDVAYRHRQLDPRCVSLAGFEGRFSTAEVEPGEYKLAVFHAGSEVNVAAFSEHRVVVAEP